jgi:hypothetical protein
MPTDQKPSSNEEEYFARANAELIREQRARLDEERKVAERRAHLNKCPKCGGELQERQFHHMKIDVCPDCGGTWLDKGELEMLGHVERSAISRFVGDMLGLGSR